MGCDIHIRAEVFDGEKWRLVGEEFDDYGPTTHRPAKRELMETMSDGALAESLAYHAYSRSDDHKPTEIGELFSDGLRAVLEVYRQREIGDEEKFKAEMEAYAQRVEAEGGDLMDDEHWDARRRIKDEMTAARINEFTLDPEHREELISKVDEFRYDWEDEEEDERRVTLWLHRLPGDPPFKTAEPWDGRNYDLFAMLANVRNGRGFAGIPTGAGFNPIADPKGVPADASEEACKFLGSFGVDGHSHTYHTLAELQAYDWDGQSTQIYGVVPVEQWERMKERGQDRPKAYSSGASGGGIATFTPEGYEAWVERGKPPLEDRGFGLGGRIFTPQEIGRLEAHEAAKAGTLTTMHGEQQVVPYIAIAWQETYREAAGTNWFKTMERLEELAPDGNPEWIRVVCFFDN